MKRFAVVGLVVVCLAPCVRAAEPLEFHVTFSPTVSTTPFTGRVYVMLTRGRLAAEPPGSLSWNNPDPTYAIDVKNWQPGETRIVGRDALGHPTPLAKLAPGNYTVWAVMDFNLGDRHFSTAEGNGYSAGKGYQLDPDTSGPVKLVIDQVYHARPPTDTDRVKYVSIESKLLTAFHGRPTMMRASVSLPASFNANDPTKRFPVIYSIPGFGGGARGSPNSTDVAGVEMLYVGLDPNCRWGHHVFADSDNNGPVGRALIEELIPHIESKYHAIGTPATRYVTGHSSGGWSSLWLQVRYPDHFGGVWSTSPDPIDFRDFQRINIYRPGENMFYEADGKTLRPLSRGQGGRGGILYKSFSDMEVVEGHGDQLMSFEAVFGPRGANGRPRDLWDKVTGRIDPEVAKAWERYDIRLLLEREWPTIGPKLKGKLNIVTGSLDTYYLEGAVVLVKESLAKLGSDAVVEILPGRNHGNTRDAAKIAREMAAAFKKQSEGK